MIICLEPAYILNYCIVPWTRLFSLPFIVLYCAVTVLRLDDVIVSVIKIDCFNRFQPSGVDEEVV